MPSVVIVGAQWGDEGKGKIVDALAEQADFVVRFQGGDNAGHTIFHDGRKVVFHILPSGMLRPRATCLIGGGVVINLTRLTEELRGLGLPEGEWQRRLRISGEAHLILPCHVALDKQDEADRGALKIGTTQRGIGPAYADRAARIGVRMADTLDEAHFRRRLQLCLEAKRGLLSPEAFQETCDNARLARECLALVRPFRELIVDGGQLLAEARREGRCILFEGAQGTMLDIGGGTYPYVTSSHTVAGGVCVGAGVGPHALDTILGVTKAYATRVGEGPFPTELKDETGETLRRVGGEFGATTGRPRRCGWLDLVQLRYATRVNSLDGLVLTKLDVLDTFERIGVCVAYRMDGRTLTDYPCNPAAWERVEPVYEYVKGWRAPTVGVRRYDELPPAARALIERIERETGVPATLISTGKERAHMIVRQEAFGKAPA